MNVSKSFGHMVAAALLAAVCAAPSVAQVSKDAPVPPVRRDDPKPIGPAANAPISGGDRQLMEDMAQAGMAEVEASRIAETNASSPEVKKFAREMVQDHGKSNRELQELAARKGVKLPTELGAEKRRELDEAKNETGARFDETYVEQTGVKDHTLAKQLFEKAAREAEDPDLKAFAAKNVPVIEHHLQTARRLDQSLEQTSSAGDAIAPDEPRMASGGEGA